MNLSGNTILITGGGTGIGFCLAEAFDRGGNTVIICGRRMETLEAAQKKIPRLRYLQCDITVEQQRRSLLSKVASEYPALNVLVNNAGIQKQVDFTKGKEGPRGEEDEIEVNFTAPVRLTTLFLTKLIEADEAAIINITSGLAFTPLAFMPLYCATKAAMHSFSLSLRHQLSGTSVKVFEVIPPTVDTELDHGERARRGQTDRGIPPVEVAEAVLPALRNDIFEIAVGAAAHLIAQSRTNPDGIFRSMNGRFKRP